MYNILVCDDEKDIVNALEIYLRMDDYRVFPARNGREALEIIGKQEIHLVLLDIMMPEMDGMETLARIREISNVPVLFLTAKSEDTDKVLGLTVGADDYITKPFNPVELQARVKSHLRRYMQLGSGKKKEAVFAIGGIELNDQTKEVLLDGEKVTLTPTEFEILKLLMQNPGVVFSPKEIYQTALSYHAVSIILLHNHPGGDPSPSLEDTELTRRVEDAGDLIGIKLLDHIIIGDRVYFSFQEEEMLK